jgi:hypothetical protein
MVNQHAEKHPAFGVTDGSREGEGLTATTPRRQKKERIEECGFVVGEDRRHGNV